MFFKLKSCISFQSFRNLFNNYFTSNFCTTQRALSWDDILSDKHICHHESMKRLLENHIPSRCILLGSPGSGKSTFTRSSKSSTERGSSFEGHTDGIEISVLGNISFWEFGGQEVLFSTHQFFMSENAQYLLVVNLFELANDDENNQCETLTEYWMKEIKTFTEINEKNCPPVIFIGTHCDQFNKHSGKNRSKKNHSGNLKKQEAIDKLLLLSVTTNLHSHKQVYELASTTIQNEYPESVMNEILKQIRSHTAEYIRRDQGFSQSGDCSFAIQYLKAKQKIEKEKASKPFMWWNEFKKEIFYSENIHSEEYIWQVSKSLKNSGVIESHRFHSSGASDLVILDPIFLTGAFRSIITLNSSPKHKQGYFTLHEIEINFHANGIQEKNMKKELLLIFEMFHLIIKLPSGEYYVPGMIHSQSKTTMHHGNEIQSQMKQFISWQSFQFIGRKYRFFPRIPFGFIERLIVRILHFPGMEIHSSSSVNYFYVFSEEDGNYNNRNFHIFIQLDENNEGADDSVLKISIYHPKEEKNHFYSFFFFHVIFQSPLEVLHSFVNSNSFIDQTILLDNQQQEMGTEFDLLMNFNEKFKHYRKYICGKDIQVFERDLFHFQFVKYLNKINNYFVWSGTKRELGKEHEEEVIFKEPISITVESLRAMFNEIILLKMIENEFTIKLIGICFPTEDLLHSRMEINKTIELTSKEDYLNHQMLMIVEKSPFGSLADRFEEMKACSISLKLKIAFDIARGINILFLKSGMKIIHRNIKPENIFIFSMDEHSTSEINSIHAKLGDLGRSVIGIPFYFQSLDDDFKYTAPEALKGSSIIPYSQPIDIYSFGILLWQLLSCKIPFYDMENENNIAEQIIEGHRPSIDDLPPDIPEEIIEMIESCWNSNPKQRMGFEKIISILSPYFKDDFKFSNNVKFQKTKYKASTAKNLKIKRKIIGKNINESFFSNIQFVGNGSDGLVMICDFHLENKIYHVALKMLMEFHGHKITGSTHRKKINEFNILSDDIQHPNIICKYGSFISIPSDIMIQNVDKSIKDLCFEPGNTNTKKKHQFYILEAYRKSLESIIESLSFHQIVKYSYQLSSALLFLFNNNIVHLDVKPDNLMISFNDDLVMIDFGHAAKLDENGFVHYGSVLVGNLLHLSPEVFQAAKEQRNLPCKLQYSWELGMIIYEMFNQGNAPFLYYTPSSIIDFSKIPNQFKELIPKLLCSENERISIEVAYNCLKNIFNNDYDEIESHSVLQKLHQKER